MSIDPRYLPDVEEILSHRRDNGADYWATPDNRLLKGAPFTTLESTLFLLELGVSLEDAVIKAVTDLLFSLLREDGRIKTSPPAAFIPVCHTALAAKILCEAGYAADSRLQKVFSYFIRTQQEDGGWKCNKYSFGRGEETDFSTPYTTLVALDILRYSPYFKNDPRLLRAVEFLLWHWEIRKPISPCHYGIGRRFLQIEYPFRGYNLFYYVYILSFYPHVWQDARFTEAFHTLEKKTVDGKIPVERVVPKLASLHFCQKGQPSELATRRYREILHNRAAQETEYAE